MVRIGRKDLPSEECREETRHFCEEFGFGQCLTHHLPDVRWNDGVPLLHVRNPQRSQFFTQEYALLLMLLIHIHP
jgi:hypothetical protein